MQKAHDSQPPRRSSRPPPKLPEPSHDRQMGKLMAIEGEYVVLKTGGQTSVLGKFMSVESASELIAKFGLPDKLRTEAEQNPQRFMEIVSQHMSRKGLGMTRFIQDDRDNDRDTYVVYRPLK